MILKEFYIEDKYGVELLSWNDERIELRTQCLVSVSVGQKTKSGVYISIRGRKRVYGNMMPDQKQNSG